MSGRRGFLSLARKLRGRSSRELRERTAQRAAALAERAGLLDAREPSDARLLGWFSASSGIDSIDAWHRHVTRTFASRWFASATDRARTVDAIRRTDPARIDQAVDVAERAMRGRLDLLGHRDLDFGTPIDWHLDPVSGIRAPLGHWSRIAYLDPRVVGDHKVVWELNRHQWLVTVGEAYWYTGDERYARFAADALRTWLDANPPKRGVNWASSLEVAFRAISWLWVIALLRESPSLDASLLARITKSLVIHARHLERNLSTWFSPNTHLTGEALALWFVGTCLPELDGAEGWAREGRRILLEQLPIHARPDGVYFEQAVYYHRYTVDFYTQLLILARRTDVPVDATVMPRLLALVEHLASLARPDGTVPLFGDEDGGRFASLDGRAIDDVRSPLATAAVLFARGDLAWIAGRPSAELVWLLGPDAPDAFARLDASEPVEGSRAYPDGGTYVMRDGWTRDALHLVIDCGPHGTANCGHAHADALAFELSVGGRPVLVDPGTYSYTTSREERDAFRSTAAHNTVSIDGESSSAMDGPFHWASTATSEVLAWHSFQDVDWFEGRHDGYRRLAAPAVHRRAVLFVKGGYWIVRDIVESEGEHDIAATFQAAPDVSLVANGLGFDATRDGHRVLRVCHSERSEESPARGAATAAAVSIDEGWVSRRYGSRVRAPRARVALRARGNTCITTALVPRTLHGEWRVEFIDAQRLEVRNDAVRDTIVLRQPSAPANVPRSTDDLDVVTDADVCWIRRRTSDGALTHAMLAGGSSLEIRVAGADPVVLTARGAACARRVNGTWLVEGENARFEQRPSLVTTS